MYRFHPQHAEVRKLLADGAIGEVRMLRASFCVRMQRPPADIRFSPDLGGGALLDVGVYAIDATRWMLGGEPVSVRGSVVLDPRGIDVSAAGVLTFGSDVLASVACSFVANAGGSYEVIGTEGRISVLQPFAQPPGRPPVVILPSGDQLAFPPDINQYELMLEAFSSAVLTGSPLPIPAESGIGNIKVIEALRLGS